MTTSAIHRGDIFLVSLDPVVGAETAKTRPCLVIQNDIGNVHSPVTIIACITTQTRRKKYSTNVELLASGTGLNQDSVILLNQIRTVDKSRLLTRIGRVSASKMQEVDQALRTSLDL